MATHIFMHMLNSLISKTSRIPVGQIFKDIILMMEEKLETRWLLRSTVRKTVIFYFEFLQTQSVVSRTRSGKEVMKILLRLLRRKDRKSTYSTQSKSKRQSEVKSEESLNSRNPSLTLRTGKEKSCPCFF